MNFQSTLSELKAERSLIDSAIQALEPLVDQPPTPRLVERRMSSTPTPASTSHDSDKPKRRRKMSTETKRKISDALKRRHRANQASA